MNKDWIAQLALACPGLDLREREPMARHISFRLGGPATAMALPRDKEELANLLKFCHKTGVKPLILGAGSNVLVSDEGVDALVIGTKQFLTQVRALDGTHLEAQCGVTMAKLANVAKELGLTGLEFAHGIPGTVGGGIFMNAGAYGGELCQVATETTVLRMDGTEAIFVGQEQGFGYRKSAFQNQDCVIVSTVFSLQPADPEEIGAQMRALSEKRRQSQPLEFPSAGSTFKRPQGGYAAALIEQAGLKGFSVGGASVSEKHAGFVVNTGGATCQDVLALIEEVQKRVYDHSGIRLEPEVRVL